MPHCESRVLVQVDNLVSTLFYMRFYGELGRLCAKYPYPTVKHVDAGAALLATQQWLRSSSVLEIAAYLRDFGHVALARDVEAVFGERVCVCGGLPRLWNVPTCHCSPFQRPVFWAGFQLLGATSWLSATGGRRLPRGFLYEQPKEDRSGMMDGDASELADDPMALFGAIKMG
jgi:hypothetical protein